MANCQSGYGYGFIYVRPLNPNPPSYPQAGISAHKGRRSGALARALPFPPPWDGPASPGIRYRKLHRRVGKLESWKVV